MRWNLICLLLEKVQGPEQFERAWPIARSGFQVRVRSRTDFLRTLVRPENEPLGSQPSVCWSRITNYVVAQASFRLFFVLTDRAESIERFRASVLIA
jgi:hypothetical protein